MANQPALVPYYSFVKGLVTDAGPLTTTENQCSAMLNVVLDIDGSLSVRPGMELHAGDFSLTETPGGGCYAYAESLGLNGGSKDVRYLCVYLGGLKVYLFDVTDINAITKVGEVTVLSNTPTKASLTAAKGHFVLATDVERPKLITLNASVDITIKIRDFIGVDDGFEVNERPRTLTDAHKYNLLNQGWPIGWARQVGYPSNADIPWVGVKTSTSSGRELFDKIQITNISFGNTPAPKGAFIIDAFDTSDVTASPQNTAITSISYDNATTTFTITVVGDLSSDYASGDSITIEQTAIDYVDGGGAVSTNINGIKILSSAPTYNDTTGLTTLTFSEALTGFVSGITVVSFGRLSNALFSVAHPQPIVENSHPVATCSFAGRVFFGGVNPGTNYRLRGTVFYSQVLDDVEKIGKCYQDQDPTARQLNEVLATDGGSIQVADMGIVYQMIPLKGVLVMLADNGVWVLAGRDGIFDPTNFTVDMVSSRGVSGPNAAADTDGSIVYYSNGQVYALGKGELGDWQARPIADGIKTYLASIPGRDDEQVQVVFNRENKVAYFNFFVSGKVVSLALDTRIGAFYPLEFDHDDVSTLKFQWCPKHNFTNNLGSLFVALKNTDDVQFVAMTEANVAEDSWSEGTIDAYATTAPAVLDSALLKKQMPRVQVYTKRQVGTGVKVQGRYSWSNSGDSGKWGSKQEGYLDRGANFDVCWRTLSVRGMGKAVQLHFSNEGTTFFKLYGWDIKYTVNPE